MSLQQESRSCGNPGSCTRVLASSRDDRSRPLAHFCRGFADLYVLISRCGTSSYGCPDRRARSKLGCTTLRPTPKSSRVYPTLSWVYPTPCANCKRTGSVLAFAPGAVTFERVGKEALWSLNRHERVPLEGRGSSAAMPQVLQDYCLCCLVENAGRLCTVAVSKSSAKGNRTLFSRSSK